MLADHDGIDDEREREAGGQRRNGFDDWCGSERADLGSGGRDVFEHGFDLLNYESGREHFDARNALGVLNGKERDDGFAVDAELMEGFEVGLESSPAGRVRTGNGERYRWHEYQR